MASSGLYVLFTNILSLLLIFCSTADGIVVISARNAKVFKVRNPD